MPEINPLLFIAPNGKLYLESRVFFKACHQVTGIAVTELWRDAYEMNLEKGDEVLFPVEDCCPPFEIVDHAKDPRDYHGFKKGGGFRLDIDYEL